MLTRYKKYKSPDAKECMETIDKWLKDSTTFDQFEHLMEWINIVEDIFRSINK